MCETNSEDRHFHMLNHFIAILLPYLQMPSRVSFHIVRICLMMQSGYRCLQLYCRLLTRVLILLLVPKLSLLQESYMLVSKLVVVGTNCRRIYKSRQNLNKCVCDKNKAI